MYPGVDRQLLRGDTLDRLAGIVDLVAAEPVDLATAAAEDLFRVQVLIGGWGCPRLEATLLERVPRLRLLAYAAGSVKTVVTDALWANGVLVSTAASANAVPVAEFTFAAIVMIAKDTFRLRDQHRSARGSAALRGVGPGNEVGTHGLRIGLVGASRIGRLVLARLQTLDCEIAISDPFLDDDDAARLGVQLEDLDDLCSWADIVSIHAPELPSTHHLIDEERLALMHDGAWLINTARGSIVDTAALERECFSGRLCALIDTPDPEPLPESSPLWDLPNVVLTPHVAGSLGNEISRMGDLAVDEIARFVAGQPLHHEVRAVDLERIA
jgi:phosphoglycerate dehydrogenase-like enzyme